MPGSRNLSDAEIMDMINRYRAELTKLDIQADRTRGTIRELIYRLSPEAAKALPHDFLAPPKKKRGRPRKPIQEAKVKKKRGRKKKVRQEPESTEPTIRTEVVDGQEMVVHTPPQPSGPRRGRPLKNEAPRPKRKRKTPIPTQTEPIIKTELVEGEEVVVHIPPPALRGRPPKKKD